MSCGIFPVPHSLQFLCLTLSLSRSFIAVILKDVSFNIMCELLEFMYQGVVNVKHTELQSFMKIGQLLQIKGLATNSNSPPGSNVSEKSTGQATNTAAGAGDEPSSSQSNNSSSNNNNNNSSSKSDAEQIEPKSNSRTPTASPSTCRTDGNHLLYMQSKRSVPADFSSDSLSIYSRKRRSVDGIDNTDSGSMEHALNAEEFFMPPIPHISMVEPRYDLGSLKREGEGHHSSVGSAAGTSSSSASSSTAMGTLRNPFAQAFNLDYNNFYKATGNSGSASNSSSSLPGSSTNNSSSNNNAGNNNNNSSSGLGMGPATEYPNELYMPSDYSKNFANHMDIPSSR